MPQHESDDQSTPTEGRTVLTRRALLGGAASSATALVAGCNSATDEQTTTSVTSTTRRTSHDEPLNTDRVRVGVIVPEISRDRTTQAIAGFYAGLHHKGGRGFPDRLSIGNDEVSVGDVDYELYVQKATTLAAASKAGALVDSANVDVVYGGRDWVDLLDIARDIDEADGTATYLAGPSGSGLDNTALCRDWIFHLGETYHMDGRTGALYLRDYANVERAFLVGHEHEESSTIHWYRQVLYNSDVEVVGQRIFYQDIPWSAVLDMAVQRDADTVIVGGRPSKWAGAYAALLDGEYDLQLVGPGGGQESFSDLARAVEQSNGTIPSGDALQAAGVGPLSCRYHPTQYENPVNDALVRFAVERGGVLPDESAATAFTAASALHQGVLAVRAGEATSLPHALRGATITETPKGTNAYEFQDHNNQARSPMTVVRPERTPTELRETWRSGLIPSDPTVRISGREAAVPVDSPESECDW